MSVGDGPAPRLALSDRGRLLALTAATWITTGLIFGLPLVTALGALPAVLLAWAFTAARVARRALEAGGVAVSLPARRPLRVVVDRPLPIRVGIELAASVRARRLALVAGVTAPAAAITSADGDASDRFVVTLCSPRVGDVWLHGFQVVADVVGGLFSVRAWVPTPLLIRVFPRHLQLRGEQGLAPSRASLQEHSGAISRRRGLGLEIRELRDFQAGDPFKHIAWSASARRGKLICREFESDLVLSTWLLLDCSPSMWWGRPGEARIDYAIETAYDLTTILLGHRDRVGLIVHDEQVRLTVQPSNGRGHLARVLRALTEVPHLVHEDRTELTDRELVERAARWFVAQRGRSFALPEGLVQTGSPRLSQHDEARLIEAAQEVLQDVALDGHGHPLIPFDGYAADYQRSVLRAFCRHAGVPLPLDPTPRPGGQAAGLEAAVRTVIASRGGPHTMVSISDFHTADDHHALRRVGIAARRRHHSLVVFCPDHRAFDSADGELHDDLQRAIVETERLEVQRRLQAAQAVLRPTGAVFLSVGPEDALARVLARLRQVA